ncbi:MAG: hypothetical protein KGH49_02925, partial [Candidatus Micrarchaeota archaeon]|nr:hypothetical protein [Candidatus Micrarchaeota archaeon]
MVDRKRISKEIGSLEYLQQFGRGLGNLEGSAKGRLLALAYIFVRGYRKDLGTSLAEAGIGPIPMVFASAALYGAALEKLEGHGELDYVLTFAERMAERAVKKAGGALREALGCSLRKSGEYGKIVRMLSDVRYNVVQYTVFEAARKYGMLGANPFKEVMELYRIGVVPVGFGHENGREQYSLYLPLLRNGDIEMKKHAEEDLSA